MNCKPGDLAICVRNCRQQGKIATCIRLASVYEISRYRLTNKDNLTLWIVDRDFSYEGGVIAPIIADEFLRPIRDQDGEDETLTWAGKPNKEHAPKEVQSL